MEQALADRVVKQTWNCTGTREEIARKLVYDFCINCANPLFEGKLQLGELKGLGEKIVYQNTGADIKTALYELLKPEGLSFSIDYDYINDSLLFNVWAGKDRTENQEINSWATFCKNFENIQNDSYSSDNSQFKNFAYVAGQGIGAKRVVVEVDKTSPRRRQKRIIR